MKKIFLYIVMAFTLFVNVFAAEDIQVVLEQPAVSEAKNGDTLKYNLIINLPKDYKSKYSSFSVTLLLDKSIEVKNTKLLNGKESQGKLDIRTTSIKGKEQNIVTINANDLSVIEGDNLNLEIETKVKSDVGASSNLKNSFVLSYVDKAGETKSDQKNLESSTKTQNGALSITDVYDGSSEIVGKTEKNAKVRVALDKKVVANVVSDANGNFKVDNLNLKEGSYIRIASETDDKKASLDYIVKPSVESKKSEELVNENNDEKELYSTVKTLDKLNDYVDFAKNLSTAKAGDQNEKRIRAAIASAEYVVVKSEVSSDEIEKSLEELLKSVEVVRKPYMAGVSENKFYPNEKITRAEAASVLKRVIDEKSNANDFSSFKDVREDAWYYDDLVFIEKEGLISGYEDGTFKPNEAMTRAQFASMMANYLKLEEGNNPIDFKDVKENYWAKDAINTLSSHGIMVGKSKDEFKPNDKITRAEAATIFNKVLDRKINKSFLDKYSKNPFDDLKRDHWAYYQIIEITAK
ncbi:MAG: S-layer homology domain-containing protein [Peptoniphilus lacydonensis]|uniref:S-layer homology domain-containing protein n=1 Tax=Peptoniphilus lacydonensis TaxID=1673725 RepID=UPI00258F505C|nr:S-layer homology domain-containing protein [Peptoniphilus lacydonensis]MDU5275511.1 S-layer homology domain-containing protein [Peptoniphilus lacydonensis]MDU7303030.1 S-layer homology domain-containing protein [Peptoniphilus lacydonensis]